ncbi:MAG: imidazole glycerol phosphate synthase subunit HisH [Cyanobacteriota bacterium]
MQRIGLIDYGMGNLHSVRRALERRGASVVPVESSREMDSCDALVLPGVGSFDPAMERLHHADLVQPIRDWCLAGRPLLGICLGLQLLFDGSDEGRAQGLGVIRGQVRGLQRQNGVPIPHMGWAPLISGSPSPLLNAKQEREWMYFVHSYAAEPTDPATITATVPYGTTTVTAAVWQGSVGACQFHPEKSSDDGQALLSRWLSWLAAGRPETASEVEPSDRQGSWS